MIMIFFSETFLYQDVILAGHEDSPKSLTYIH